jgi:hypothetical protein
MGCRLTVVSARRQIRAAIVCIRQYEWTVYDGIFMRRADVGR